MPDTAPDPVTSFDRTTQVRRVGTDDEAPATFAADLDESWSSLLGVHGGYVTALAVRAAQTLAPERHVRTVSTSFFRPSRVGPVEITIETIRSGRTLSTLVAEVHQLGRAISHVRITMLAPVASESWATPVTDRPAPIAECVPFESPFPIRHFSQARLQIDPATNGIATGDGARMAGHVRPVETRPLDALWLVMAGDWFPPSPFRRVVPPIGGVSIDYTVHIHRTLPADRDLWLEGVFEAPDSVDGIALEHGTLATPQGDMVAETFHTRWTGH